MLAVKRLTRRSIWMWLALALLVPTFSARISAQDEKPKERDTRDKREREKKANENERLNRDGDRVVDRDEKLSGKEDRVTDTNERLARDGERKSDNEKLKRDEGKNEDERARDESARGRDNTQRTEQGFRSQQEFDDHYQKHVIDRGEWGKEGITREEYLRKAQELRDTPADGKNVEQIDRADNRVSKYDHRDNGFGVYERDGTVVTYFRPTEKEAYFRNQNGRVDQ